MEQDPWEELDRCETADEIAELLRRLGIRGIPADPRACPLAVATGWRVVADAAWTVEDAETLRGYISSGCCNYDELTPGEREIVRSRYGRSDYRPDHRFVYWERDLTQAQTDFVRGLDSGDYRDLLHRKATRYAYA
jgi:hypothetical protein